MYLNVDVRQFQAILQLLPELPHIHVQIHCNAFEKVNYEKGYWCQFTRL